jgi:beta-xylosidase
MSRSILICNLVVGLCLTQCSLAADNGDGTYSTPPLYADFPDPDVIRVGDDFYMVSTTFMNSPGLALLHSKDLVNWTTINNIVDRLEFGNDSRQDMVGGTLYRNGIYAPSIRYNNGTFYVAVQPNGISGNVPLQIFRTTDPRGEWQRNQLNFGAFDPALHFEDDGTPYVVYGGAWQDDTFMRQLNPGLTSSVGGEQVIKSVAGTSQPRLEGAHVIKTDGYYYIFNAAPGQGRMYISRSNAASLATSAGTWTTVPSVSGATGGHQGAIVDLEGGDWYGFVMRDSGAVGRMTNISPISWENEWPLWGTNNQVPGQAPKPILDQPIVVHPQSTNFDGPKLPLDFRWNHNPDDSRWSLSERSGYLRLKPTVASDFWNARNSLTYKGFGPTSQAVVEMDIANLEVGDNAGLGMIGKGLATLSVQRLANGQAQLVLSTGSATASSGPMTQQATAALGNANTVYLTLRMNFTNNQGQTAYSLDGVTWNTIGNSFPLLWDWATGTFQGEQYAVFNFNAAASSGLVDINRFSFIQRSDIDMDGDVDASDYIQLRTYHLATLQSDSPLETLSFGDVDGDLDNDYDDFRQFKSDFVAAHGAAAFSDVIKGYGTIPEPSGMNLTFLGSLFGGACWRLRVPYSISTFSISNRQASIGVKD